MAMRRVRPATVLAYHAVGSCPAQGRPHRCVCISMEAFRSQLRFLSRFRRVVPLSEALQSQPRPGPPAVAITFDDAYENVLVNALPLLERYGFVASLFVPTRWIGARNSWDAHTSCYPLDIMDAAALREADGRGLTVESHGHGHIDLVDAHPSSVAEDLEASVASLTAVLGRPPRYLAYPYGRQTADTRRAAEAAGFEDAFLFDEIGLGRFARGRVSIDGYEGRARLRLKTSGEYLARRRSPVGSALATLVRRVVPSRVGS